jgi:hypothetical protein
VPETRSAIPLSPAFLCEKTGEAVKLRRGQVGGAVDGNGHDAFGLRAFPFRPEQKGKDAKNGDRYDSCAHEGRAFSACGRCQVIETMA